MIHGWGCQLTVKWRFVLIIWCRNLGRRSDRLLILRLLEQLGVTLLHFGSYTLLVLSWKDGPRSTVSVLIIFSIETFDIIAVEAETFIPLIICQIAIILHFMLHRHWVRLPNLVELQHIGLIRGADPLDKLAIARLRRAFRPFHVPRDQLLRHHLWTLAYPSHGRWIVIFTLLLSSFHCQSLGFEYAAHLPELRIADRLRQRFHAVSGVCLF